MSRLNVLILAGTTEAAELIGLLRRDDRLAVTASLAGRTRRPAELGCPTRVGGFGGVEGLAAHLMAAGIDVLVDATHPFAATMPLHAATAAEQVGVPRVRLLRPGWTAVPGDRWHRVPDLAAAADRLVALQATSVLLATGRLELAPFAPLADPGGAADPMAFVLRSIEPPDPQPMAGATVLLARGPFTVHDELALLRAHGIGVVVTKDSGGTATSAKLDAARHLGLPVVVVDRPTGPPGPVVATAAEAAAWLSALIPAAP